MPVLLGTLKHSCSSDVPPIIPAPLGVLASPCDRGWRAACCPTFLPLNFPSNAGLVFILRLSSLVPRPPGEGRVRASLYCTYHILTSSSIHTTILALCEKTRILEGRGVTIAVSPYVVWT